MDFSEHLKNIQNQLEQLKNFDLEYSVHGSKKHRYLHKPKMTEMEVTTFEQGNQISLPPEYRYFITHFGNGGVGPGYGLLPLSPLTFCKEFSLPFPRLENVPPFEEANLEEPSNSEESILEDSHLESKVSLAEEEVIDGYEDWKDEWDDEEFDEKKHGEEQENNLDENIEDLEFSTNEAEEENEEFEDEFISNDDHGILTLADRGCGSFYFLVLTGSKQGSVWADNSAGDGSIKEVAPDFFTWYQNWLEQSFENLAAEKQRVIERIHELEESLQKNPEDWSTQWILGNFLRYFPQKEHDQRLMLLGKSFDDAQLHESQLSYFQKNNDREHLKIALSKAEKTKQMQDMLALQISQAYQFLGDQEQACHWIKKAEEYFAKEFHFPERYFDFGKITKMWLRLGDAKAAYRMFQYKEVPDFDRFCQSLNQEKRYQEVVALCAQKLHLDKEELYERGYAFAELQQWDLALSDYQSCEQQGMNISANIAFVLYHLKRYEEAIKRLSTLEETPWILNLLGCCYSKLGKIEGALTYLKKSYQINYDLLPYDNIGYNLILLGNYQLAKTVLEEVVDCDPNYSWAYYHLAIWYAVQKQTLPAIEQLKKAYQLGFSRKVAEEEPLLAEVMKQSEYQNE